MPSGVTAYIWEVIARCFSPIDKPIFACGIQIYKDGVYSFVVFHCWARVVLGKFDDWDCYVWSTYSKGKSQFADCLAVAKSHGFLELSLFLLCLGALASSRVAW